jgi:hypothetical protein
VKKKEGEQRSLTSKRIGTKDKIAVVMRRGMILPKRLVMARSALAWASVGNS